MSKMPDSYCVLSMMMISDGLMISSRRSFTFQRRLRHTAIFQHFAGCRPRRCRRRFLRGLAFIEASPSPPLRFIYAHLKLGPDGATAPSFAAASAYSPGSFDSRLIFTFVLRPLFRMPIFHGARFITHVILGAARRKPSPATVAPPSSLAAGVP